MSQRRFIARAESRANGGVFVPVPFDPDEAWGRKTRHHVRGTVNGMPMRGVIEPADRRGLALRPAWQRDCGVPVGAEVEVVLEPEGPQRADLADDVAAALAASGATARHDAPRLGPPASPRSSRCSKPVSRSA